MATRDLLSKFRSISRPSLSSGSYSSLAKKTQSAEDSIIDTQYEDGVITAEAYLANLNSRLSRSYITPLQRVNLQEKISNVQTNLVDADVDRQYKAGQVSTAQLANYEKDKLAQMTPGSEAYIRQQTKVQGLIDKAEREARTAFRISESKRLSALPDDSTDILYQKVQVFDTLANQARLDGDNQQADVLETQKNNYLASAKRSEINDVITNARLSVSGEETTGMGVPSAESGSQLYSQLFGGKAPNYSTPAIKNALEGLDRSKKSLDRLYQSYNQKQQMLGAYEAAVNAATGDQKTTLTIAYNNLKDSLAQTENQIALTTQNVEETAVRIQEAAVKAAYGSSKKEITREDLALKSEEAKLETDLRRGYYEEDGKRVPVTSQWYIGQMIKLNTARMQWAANAEAIYRGNGDDTRADQIMSDLETKYGNQGAAQIRDRLLGAISQTDDPAEQEKVFNEALTQIASDYALVRVEPGGTLDDISSSQRQAGEVSLKNIRLLRDRGMFNSNYINDNGVWTKIYTGGDESLTGSLLSPNQIKQLASQGQADLFYYDSNGNKKRVMNLVTTDANGQRSDNFVTEDYLRVKNPDGSLGEIKPIFKERNANTFEIEQIKGPGAVSKTIDAASRALGAFNPYASLNDPNRKPINPLELAAGAQDLAEKLPGLKGAGETVRNFFQDTGKSLSPVQQAIQRGQEVAGKAIANFRPADYVPDFLENAFSNAGQVVNKAGEAIVNVPKQLLAKAASFLPKFVPPAPPTPEPAYASDNPPAQFIGPQRPAAPSPNYQYNIPAPKPVAQPAFKLPQVKLPQISVPKINLPQIQLPKINFQPIQQAASNFFTPVVNTAKNVANKVGSFLGGLFGRK